MIALEVLRVAGAVQVGQHDPPRWRPVLPSGWLVAEAAQAKREELPDEPETLLVRLTAKGLRLQKSLKRKSNTGERKNTRKSVLQPLLEAYRKHLDVVGAGRAWKDHLPDGPEMRLTLGQKGETVWEPTERSLEAQCVGWVESASSVQMQLFIRLLKAEYRPVSLRSIPEVLALHALRIAGEVQVAQLDDPGQPEVLLARLRDSDLPNDHR
ncbi:MAG TPA: hypothetical protein VM223_21150, partial [Planctomycetota bacterium]|nr:hypothetical protein [Planctomycetota bacterium]